MELTQDHIDVLTAIALLEDIGAENICVKVDANGTTATCVLNGVTHLATGLRDVEALTHLSERFPVPFELTGLALIELAQPVPVS